MTLVFLLHALKGKIYHHYTFTMDTALEIFGNIVFKYNFC